MKTNKQEYKHIEHWIAGLRGLLRRGTGKVQRRIRNYQEEIFSHEIKKKMGKF